MRKKILIVVNVDWFFMSHRLLIAKKAIKENYEVHLATHITLNKNIIEAHGIIVHSLPISRSSTNPFSIINYCFYLSGILRKVNPDLLHLVTIKPVIFGGLLARIQKIPSVIYAISGMGYLFISKNFLDKILKNIVLLAYRIIFNHTNSLVICQNPSDLNLVFKKSSYALDRAILIPGSGVELNRYSKENIIFENPNQTVVMFASRLLKDKGIYEFIQAAEFIKKECKDLNSEIIFVLVGDIDIENRASVNMDEVNKWEERGLIQYWGYSDRIDKMLYMADIFVLPSYREGMPKILLEASACSLPIITTDVPGCRDAVIPNETGLIVPPRDSRALSLAISELLRNHQKAILLGQNARKHAEKNFDVNLVAKKHIDIYKFLDSKVS